MKIDLNKKIDTHEEVIEELMEMIQTGAFLPGELLPNITDIADQLSFSESEVNKAFAKLIAENIILERSGGLFLTKSDKDLILSKIRNSILSYYHADIIELLEIREGLETRAIALACERVTTEDLEAIKSALDDLENAVRTGLTAAKEDLKFHLAIVKATHNSTLIQLMEIIFERFAESLQETRTNIRKLDRVDHFIDTHRLMYDVIVSKNGNLGVELMKTHIEDTISLYKGIKG